jgi:diguanylate cyclase (GGDEF)-like protein
VVAKRQLVSWRDQSREQALRDFKLANTRYGYVGGDKVLCCAADVLREITRGEDLVARVGGDEFAMLVYGAPEPDLQALSQRIVETMRNAKLPFASPDYRLTASVGVAMLETEGEDVDALLGSADRHLRRAKSTGKDRWEAPRAGAAERREAGSATWRPLVNG